jgi:hypothetical protein
MNGNDTSADTIHLAVVGCSSSKFDVDGKVRAHNLYKGSYWSNKNGYGHYVADDSKILSAEHGLISPFKEIEHYDTSVDDLHEPVDPTVFGGPTKIDQWASNVRDELNNWLAEQDPNKPVLLEVLIGKSYRTPLDDRGVFDDLDHPNVTVKFPFQEYEQATGGLMNQIRWMSDMVNEAHGRQHNVSVDDQS